ncbi:PepSY domain-containing protein [Aerosticca soli]|jgi:hypothetical protein|uniref:PepSY domain-containing protein n=1 Tax=Aerosticca soli TaxID=2010829 RepID=A0A2Z6E332_9GAMM|nr:hypothetical protein [Aerosticca soli]MDI3262062.1 hypothetical protein [Fulvimonas sp.]BBD79475.1 hypothetical protein ALSL_0809 [Aerosticca soli]
MRKRLLILVLPALAGTAAHAARQELSLEQAVAHVQQESGGTILSADTQHRGRRVEYRIKVLTPDGHVRVLAVPADGSAESTKSPAGNGAGGKEKH